MERFKMLRKLIYISMVISGLLSLSVSPGVASPDLAVSSLEVEEAKRQRLMENGLDTLPNTYEIFQKLNKIQSGPSARLANEDERKIIAISVIENAFTLQRKFVGTKREATNEAFRNLINQYLVMSDTNPSTLPTRMAYLAISAIAMEFEEHGKILKKTDTIIDNIFVRHQDSLTENSYANLTNIFTKQIRNFYDLVCTLNHPEVVNSTAALPLAAQLQDYPKSYQGILAKIKTKQITYDEAIDVIDAIDSSILLHNGAVEIKGENTVSIDVYLKRYGLTANDVDYLAKISSISYDFVLGEWVKIRKNSGFGFSDESKQAVANVLYEINDLIKVTKDISNALDEISGDLVQKIEQIENNLSKRYGISNQSFQDIAEEIANGDPKIKTMIESIKSMPSSNEAEAEAEAGSGV